MAESVRATVADLCAVLCRCHAVCGEGKRAAHGLSLNERKIKVANVARSIVVRFFAEVDATSINNRLNVFDQKLAAGVRRFTLLISSPGGTVFHGLSAYNYLRGIPAEVVTHNFGSIDSIGVVLYCAGSRRLSVPHARFLLHGVSAGFAQNERLEEMQLEERLKSLQIDILNIAHVVASTSGKSVDEVNRAMLDRTTLRPDEAKTWGLVHDIQSELFAFGDEAITIQQAQGACAAVVQTRRLSDR